MTRAPWSSSDSRSATSSTTIRLTSRRSSRSSAGLASRRSSFARIPRMRPRSVRADGPRLRYSCSSHFSRRAARPSGRARSTRPASTAIGALVSRPGLPALESIELLCPPIVNEMKRMTPELQDAYVQGRAAIGPLAQGPAGILVRVGDTCVFGVDALGLRPLWHVETEDEHVFASERGFVPLERYITDPVPLGPGERVALRLDR